MFLMAIRPVAIEFGDGMRAGRLPIQETHEVCQAFLQDPAFFRFLTRIDEKLAAVARLGGCRFCEGPLHVGDYPRKPRGCLAAVP